MLRLILTLLAHYRKHPIQGLFLLTGIIVANVLLVGTLLINAQARASYAQGENYLGAATIGQIRHKDRNRLIDEQDYVFLRRSGFDMLVPQLRQLLRTDDGKTLDVSGIDAFAMPRSASAPMTNPQNGTDVGDITGFAFPPYQLWAAPARLEQLGASDQDRIRLASGVELPPLMAVPNQQFGYRMFMDINALQELVDKRGKLSSILVFSTSPERKAELISSLPAELQFINNDDTPDPQELTRSFHLNLAAMGLLAFVVGLFLTYNAIAFSYTDRHDLLRKLRLAGILKWELRLALLLELSLFLGAGIVTGTWLGAKLSALLLPGVGQTLAQLYGVYIAYPDSLAPTGIWLPWVMTIIAAALCVAFPMREALNAPLLDRRQYGWNISAVIRRDRMLAMVGIFLLITALVITLLTKTLWLALTGMACLLLGAAFLLPLVLRLLIAATRSRVSPRHARLSWLLADSRWLLGPASLALMAMTMALLANSGLNTMINSFRTATDDWLSQRLVANLYIRGGQDMMDLENWLATEMPRLRTGERYLTTETLKNPSGEAVLVEIISLRSGERFRNSVKLMRGVPDAETLFHDGKGVYISERAWRLDGWQPGSLVELCGNDQRTEVLGVYRDYGNPRSQWMLNRDIFQHCWPQSTPAGLAVYGPQNTDWETTVQHITQRFELRKDQIINQTELKKIGMAVFDRTFSVTHALNALTLLVAAIGIFCAVSAIHHHRVAQQALLSSLGLTRRERAALLLLQWGLLGLFCMALVWPFGTMLAAYLGTVVTPAAFGWSFPLVVEWQHYLSLALVASSCLVVAVFLPSLQLLRTSPAAMLREQNL